MFIRICFIICVFSLTACSSSGPGPKVQYYLLDTASDRSLTTDGASQLAEVRVGAVPDYLNQNALIMMVSEHTLEIARYHKWADRLTDSIARVVEYEYNQALIVSEADSACEQCRSIVLFIEHFYPTADGDVFLTGFYQYNNDQSAPIKKRFNLQGRIQGDGYKAAVVEMRQLLVELSAHIAQEQGITQS
ncbi:membrane integrity-associated transporter subunit PqiC [Glaciecola siphonariae]|uniref:Membrane integrity-associated transporter subunit PqiC n=1 Tax=Glaciecola siphonariae TaxID=521012 RepID=A0ABV9M163_9ALTE